MINAQGTHEEHPTEPGTALLLAAAPAGKGCLIDAAAVLPALAAVPPSALTGTAAATVVELADPLDPQAVLTRIRTAAALPGPLHLYITGQLHLDHRQRLLHFALARTTPSTLRYTALPWHWLTGELALRRPHTTSVVVDLVTDAAAWDHVRTGGLGLGHGVRLYGRVAPPPPRRTVATPDYLKSYADIWRTGERPARSRLHEAVALHAGPPNALFLSQDTRHPAPTGGPGAAQGGSGPTPGAATAATRPAPPAPGAAMPTAPAVPPTSPATSGRAASARPSTAAPVTPGPAAPVRPGSVLPTQPAQAVPASAAPVRPGRAPLAHDGPGPTVPARPAQTPPKHGAPAHGAPAPSAPARPDAAHPVSAPAPGPRPAAGGDPHGVLLAAARAGRHSEAAAIAAMWESEALRAHGAGSPEAIHWLEVRADLARLAQDPPRSCELWTAVAQARLARGEARTDEDVEAAVDRAHHQWEQIADPARAKDRAPALSALRHQVPGRRPGALEAIQRRLEALGPA
ncbi:hypothetical protein [Streptomyces sp. NPDC016845]|uniref:hypothetical protein n=1 Tax=Streptomyces sp. NPDC016845 TaxID=3364972 RepID=UPI0037BADB79